MSDWVSSTTVELSFIPCYFSNITLNSAICFYGFRPPQAFTVNSVRGKMKKFSEHLAEKDNFNLNSIPLPDTDKLLLQVK